MNAPIELVEQFAHDNGVIFVGAGLSQGAGLPSWADLVHELANELAGCPSGANHCDIAQYYETEYGRNRLVQRLRDRLDTLKVSPTPVHDELVQLPVSAIFTTNYDDLLEKSLRANSCPFDLVIANVDVSFSSAHRLQLVKLHGDLSQPESIVITTEDYERFTLQRPSLARLLATTLQTRTVLFLGYSATDLDLRLILTQVRAESGRFARNLYTTQFNAPSVVVKDLERRGLKVIHLGSQPNAAACNAVLLEWLQTLNKRIASNKSEIEIRINRNLSHSAYEIIEDMVDELAHMLSLPRDRIRVLDVRGGSIILLLLMPTRAVNRLITLCEADAPIMQDFIRKFEIEKVRVIHKQTLQTPSSVPVSPRKEFASLELFPMSGDLREPSSAQQKVIPFKVLPVIDKIAAGKAKPASDDIIGHIQQTGELEFESEGRILKAELLRGSRLTFLPEYEYFAVQVSGDSMDRAGISAGDFVIVQKPKHFPLRPSPGDIVAAVIRGEDNEATLKRLKFEESSNSVIFEPESSNPVHKPLVVQARAFAGDNPPVGIVGIAIAVLKQ